MLQKQRLHFPAAPVVDREGQLSPGQMIVPQKVPYEVDSCCVEEFGVEVCHLLDIGSTSDIRSISNTERATIRSSQNATVSSGTLSGVNRAHEH